MISYLDYKAKYLGESNVGNTPQNMGECNGLVQLFFALNGLPHVVGNAKDIYNAASNDLFEKLPPDAQVKQGDVFVCGKPWGLNPSYNPRDPNSVQYFGHDGFVDQPGQGQSFLGFEQNGVLATPHKVQLVFHQQRNGFTGFLRLKNQEQIMDKNDAIAYYLGTLHRPYPAQVSDAEINGLIGKKLSDVIAQERNSTEWLTQNDILLRAYPAAQQLISQLNAKIQQLQNEPTQQEIIDLKAEVANLTTTISQLETKQ